MIMLNVVSRLIGAIVLCPPETVDPYLPMMAPLPTYQEWQSRRQVDQLLDRCWNSNDGFDVHMLSDEWVVNHQESGSDHAACNDPTILQQSDIDEWNNVEEDSVRPSTYGEVTTKGARQLFQAMGMTTSTTKSLHFMDGGSGAGRLVVQAYLEVEHCVQASGVELAPSRHDAAKRAEAVLHHELLQRQLGGTKDVLLLLLSSRHRGLSLQQGDFFEADLSDVTHLYLSSLCFTETMMSKLDAQLSETHQCPLLQCVASLQPIPRWKPSDTTWIEMSWTKPFGQKVYLYDLSTRMT